MQYFFYIKQTNKKSFGLYIKKNKQFIDKIGSIYQKDNSFIITINDLKLNFWLKKNLILTNNISDNIIDRYLKCKLYL